MKKFGVLLLALCIGFLGFSGTQAQAAKYELKIQTALSTASIYYKTLERLKSNIEKLSGGELTVELFGEGSIVKAFEIQDSVSENLINGGMGWTHYASGKHPAAVLFSAPCGGLGFGLDQDSILAWEFEGDGFQLLQDYYQNYAKINIVAYPVLPMGPEAFGWFHKKYTSVEEYKKLTYRAPPGVPTEVFKEMGMPVVSMAGPDIIPAAQRGAIDAAEWIAPGEDIAMGLDQVWKHYYLQGLHQAISIGDIYINKGWFDALPQNLKDVINIAMKACLADQMMMNISLNSAALQDMVKNRGVVIEETPADYYPAFMKAARAVFGRYAEKDAFFKKVMDSELEWAKMTVPFQMRANGLYYQFGKVAMEEGIITDYKK